MIRPVDLEALMCADAPHAVLDVGERGRYERGHVFRATSLPRRLLEFRLPDLVTAPRTTIVACDDDGRIGGLARPLLHAMGYTDVRVLAGGLEAWRAEGRPLCPGRERPEQGLGERALHEMKTPQIAPRGLADRTARRRPRPQRGPERRLRAWPRGRRGMVCRLELTIRHAVRDRDAPVVVTCAEGTQSTLAAATLAGLGYARVRAREGGTAAWPSAGLDVERGATRMLERPTTSC